MATTWHFHATSDAACTPINRMFNSFCSAAAVPANPCMPNYSVMLPCSGSISCGTCHILAWALYTWPCHHGTNHNDTFKNGFSGSLHAVLAWFAFHAMACMAHLMSCMPHLIGLPTAAMWARHASRPGRRMPLLTV